MRRPRGGSVGHRFVAGFGVDAQIRVVLLPDERGSWRQRTAERVTAGSSS
jgi:hypothetical protein